MTSRVIAHRLPACPSRDSRFTIRHNPAISGDPWWVHYENGGSFIPADAPHVDLVAAVNELKRLQGQPEGGSFSINEHGQVIARMAAPPGHGQAVHVVGHVGGVVASYAAAITFRGGQLDPTMVPAPGAVWPGPLCGMSYTFPAPSNPKAPSRCVDDVFVEVEGQILQLSSDANIQPYPPAGTALAIFLQSLRRLLPQGGRFRVNEHARAFTSDKALFVGIVPLAEWFKPLHVRS
jgi:hypothetical protein